MKRYCLATLFILLSAPVFSQTVSDVLKFSYLHPGGTARFLGAGSSMGALGVDFGTLSTNPAGLGRFHSGELTVTPGIRFVNTDASLPGNFSSEESTTAFGLENAGLIFNSKPASGRWKAFNFGLGLNRQNNYNQAIFYTGEAAGTIMNSFFGEALDALYTSGRPEEDLNPFGALLAWDANAIYYQDGNLTYDFFGFFYPTLERSQKLTISGSMNEAVFSFAGNYDEKLMAGFTIGVPFVKYNLESEYIETDPGGDEKGNVPYFGQLIFTDFLETKGFGINFKMGLIYRINNTFRLGAAFHTPTGFSLTDNYNNTFTYDYAYGGIYYPGETFFSPDGTFTYKLRTPWRAIASAAVVVKKAGFINVDVEWVDYRTNRYNFNSDAANNANELIEHELNSGIQNTYRSTMNIRIGGEVALDQFRLLGGMNLNGKPIEGESGFDTGYSTGAGFRSESFFIDLAYRRFTSQGFVSPYPGAPGATTNSTANDIVMTVGFKF